MDQSLREQIFEDVLKSPGAWLMNALWLKRAAEEIDWWKHRKAEVNSPEGDFVFMLPVFHLLYGLSFENLLKGIIVAQRGCAGAAGAVDADLTTHSMKDLVSLLDKTKAPISNKELDVLNNLERYVVWAGRYPLPKKTKDIFAKVYSYDEYQFMISLWDRLFALLRSIGWITKMGGFKLWTDSSKNTAKGLPIAAPDGAGAPLGEHNIIGTSTDGLVG